MIRNFCSGVEFKVYIFLFVIYFHNTQQYIKGDAKAYDIQKYDTKKPLYVLVLKPRFFALLLIHLNPTSYSVSYLIRYILLQNELL
jgi:hypothetical protein